MDCGHTCRTIELTSSSSSNFNLCQPHRVKISGFALPPVPAELQPWKKGLQCERMRGPVSMFHIRSSSVYLMSYVFVLGRFARILFRLYIVHNHRCSRPHLQIQRRTSLACLVHLLPLAICEDSRHHPQAIVGASEAFGVALPSFERSDGYRTAEVV